MRLHYALEDSSKTPHMEALQRPCRIIHCLLLDDHHDYEYIAKSSLILLARPYSRLAINHLSEQRV